MLYTILNVLIINVLYTCGFLSTGIKSLTVRLLNYAMDLYIMIASPPHYRNLLKKMFWYNHCLVKRPGSRYHVPFEVLQERYPLSQKARVYLFRYYTYSIFYASTLLILLVILVTKHP